MYQVLITDKMSEDALSVLDSADDIEVTVSTGMNQEQLKEVISAVDGIIVRSSVQLDEEILEAATNLKAIVRAGVGVDNVDIPAVPNSTGKQAAS